MKSANIQVIYEDNHLIAVNKPVGVLVHGDHTGDLTLADMTKRYIKHRYNKPGDVFLGVIHRLDRPVSGVVVFARTSKALTRMNEAMKKRKIDKEYKAIVHQRPPDFQGRLTHYISKDKSRNVVNATKKETKGSKLGILDYIFELEVSRYILLTIFPRTGRSHQIRVQLKSIGCPIVGDKKYGYTSFNEDRGICLHCHKISFVHPVKKEPVTIVADLPVSNYWNLFK